MSDGAYSCSDYPGEPQEGVDTDEDTPQSTDQDDTQTLSEGEERRGREGQEGREDAEEERTKRRGKRERKV